MTANHQCLATNPVQIAPVEASTVSALKVSAQRAGTRITMKPITVLPKVPRGLYSHDMYLRLATRNRSNPRNNRVSEPLSDGSAGQKRVNGLPSSKRTESRELDTPHWSCPRSILGIRPRRVKAENSPLGGPPRTLKILIYMKYRPFSFASVRYCFFRTESVRNPPCPE
jgi:hypothetical protein